MFTFRKFCVIVGLFFILISIYTYSSQAITQDSVTNFTIGSQVKLKSFWQGGLAYWYVIDPQGNIVSYWTFPQVQSYKTSGGGSWQYEIPSSLDSSVINGNKLTQNYTLASGSKLSVVFEEQNGNKIKMTWGVYGAYNRNYRIDFTSNSVPSNKGNLNNITKIFEFNNLIRYRYDDITGYSINNSVDANKNFHQYIEVGNAYLVWKWIDPIIEGGATGTTTKTCAGLSNSSWCNLSTTVNAISGTVNFTNIVIGLNDTLYSDYARAIYFPSDSNTGIGTFNVSNATGTNNVTHIFLNQHSNSTNFTDVKVRLNNNTNVSFWFDNDTSQSNGWIRLMYNKTASGSLSIVYGKSGANDDRNLSAVMPYADGWNGFWNYSYSGDGTWTVQPNGTYMQTNDDGLESKKRYITNTVLSGSYQVTAKLRVVSGSIQNGKFGVVLGNDGTYDIESVTQDSVGTTKHNILQYGVAWGTQGSHYQSLVTGKWLMWDGKTTGTAQQGRTYQVNDIEVPWQSSGSFTSSTNKRIGIASGYGQVDEYQYWYAWSGTKIAPPASASQEVTAGANSVSVWAEPQGHPQSEIKNCITTFCLINLTITSGTNIQNIRLFGNWTGTISAMVTLEGYFNITNITEYSSSGYYHYNSSILPDVDIQNAKLTYPIKDGVFIGSSYKGLISVYTNDSNASSPTYNQTYIRQNSSWLSVGIYKYFNFTILYNNAPSVSASNVDCASGSSCSIPFNSSDSENNALNNSLRVNGTVSYGSSPHSRTGLTLGNYTAYLNVTDFNGTIGGASVWTNITFWVNVSADTTPPPKPTIANGTVTTTTIPLNSTNTSSDIHTYFWQQRVNGTSGWSYIGNTTINTTTALGLTSGQIYDFRVQVNDTSGNPSVWSDYITVQTSTSDPTLALIIVKLNDIQAKQLEQDTAIDEAKAMGFVGGVLGGALVIGVLRRRRF